MKVKAVIFDMDGVILDTESVSRYAWKMAEKEFGIPITDEFLESLIGINRQDAIPIFKRVLNDQETWERVLEWRHKLIWEKYDRESMPIKPGAREIFAYLREKGIPAALATSSTRAIVDDYLARAGFSGFFDAILTGDTLSNGKPHPEIYWKAAQALGKDIHECMVIEDSIRGVLGGAASGAITVMVPDMVQPDREVREKAFAVEKDLLAVMALIERLNQDG